MNLKGQVKSIKEVFYFLPDTNFIEGSKFYSSYRFDIEGDKKIETFWSVRKKYVYKNNEQSGQKKLKQIKTYHKPFNSSIEKIIFNKNGRLTKVLNNSSLIGNHTFTYNKDGQLKQITCDSGIFCSTVIYRYINNILIESITYKNDTAFHSKTLYFYNNKNQIIKEELYNKKNLNHTIYNYLNGNIISKKEFLFDDNWNVKEMKIYTFKYEFDESKNWIKCTQFKNGVRYIITARKIKYYN